MTRGTLSDTKVMDLLRSAQTLLDDWSGETGRGQTTLDAARQALVMLQIGLMMAADQDAGYNQAITPPPRP